MKSINSIILFLVAALALFSNTHVVAEVNVPAKPPAYVVDLAGVIEPEVESALNAYLAELEQKTTAQMFVLTIASLEGESLEDFSIHVAHDMWKIGQQDKDNGVLLLVSLQDRRARLEIGYGLEGALTDAYSRRILEQALFPQFRQGDYSRGIALAVSAVVSQIAADSGIEMTGESLPGAVQSYPERGDPPRESSALQTLWKVILFIAAIFLFIRYPRLFILLLLMSGGGRRGGWGGGGGFSGGGGFGGGGGGGFGGGGASGGW